MEHYLFDKELRATFKEELIALCVLLIGCITFAILSFFQLAFLIVFVMLLFVVIVGSIGCVFYQKRYHRKATIKDGCINVYFNKKFVFSINLYENQKSVVNVNFFQGRYRVQKKCIVIHKGYELVKNGMKFYCLNKDLLYVQNPELISIIEKND